MKKMLVAFAALAMVGFGAFICTNTSDEHFSGRVIDVHDGDTLTVTRWNTPVKVRLAHIDSPELGQAFGPEARDFANKLCLGKVVDVYTVGRDLYGRTIADVSLPNRACLNEEIVENGFAWCYQQGTPADHVIRKLEDEARTNKRGLWSTSAPTAPRDHRHHSHELHHGFVPWLCPASFCALGAYGALGAFISKKFVALIVMLAALFCPMADWKRNNLSLVRTELRWLSAIFLVMLGFLCL